MNIRKLVFLAGLSALSAVPLLSQNADYARIAMRNQVSQIYHEAVVVPDDSLAGVVVSFRIPNDRLVFVRNRDISNGNAFVAAVKVSIEMVKDGSPYKEQSWTRDHFAIDFDATQDKNIDLTGNVTLRAEPGFYQYRMILIDENRDQESQSMPRPLVVPDFSELATATPAIIGTGGDGQMSLLNLGGDVAYAQPAKAAIIFSAPEVEDVDSVQISYSLYRMPPVAFDRRRAEQNRNRRLRATREGREAIPMNPDAADEIPQQLENAELVFSGEVDKGQVARVEMGELENNVWNYTSGSGDRFLAFVNLRADQLENGSYTLVCDISVGGNDTKSIKRFSTHWRNMPASLFDIDVAIEMLEYIEEKDVIRALKKGSFEEKTDRFLSYWKEKDPSPGTVFNELMTEYYRRIDFAALEYSTGGRLDGLESDRAKVYILNGPPLAVDRELPDGGGVQEIWRYPGGRTFVFEASSSLDSFYLVQ